MKILLMLIISFMLSISILNAQKLNKTDILQDDIYLYPPNYLPPPAPADYLNRNFNRLRLRLTDIRSILRGDFNGDGFQELALIGDLNEFYQDEIHNLQISTLESRAYEIVNSRNDYGNPVLVNTQEGYSGMRMLDHPSNSTRNGSNTFSGQTPKNAIIDRYSSGITLNSNTFAVSGNFYPVSGAESNDEILLFRNTGSNVENVTMFAYNDPTPSYIMDYNFTESTVYNSNFPDFDIESQNWVAVLDMIGSDGRDEVYILKRTGTNQNKIFSFRYNGSTWLFELKKTFLDSQVDFRKIRGIASGDFNGDGTPEIMLAYDFNSTQQKLLSIKMDNIAYIVTDFKNINTSDYDFNKIESFIGGDFNGDGKAQIAFFYKNGEKQEIIMQKLDMSGLPVLESMLTASSNHIKFDKNIMKCITSINIDYDVSNRDDIVGLYLTDNDGIQDDVNFNVILKWISLPEFTENDFMISVLENEAEVPFIPIGDFGVRLVSEIETTLVSATLSLGYRSDDFLYKHRKMFNTLVAGTGTFCDMYPGHHYNEMPTGQDQYDHIDNEAISPSHPEKTYVNALKSYLNRADDFGYKVVPFISIGSAFDYDKIVPDFHKYVDFSSNTSSWPEFFRYLFELDPNQTPEIQTHPANLFYIYVDEPLVQTKNNSETAYNFGMGLYANHFWRNRVGYQSVYNYPTTTDIEDAAVFKNVCDNVYNGLKNNINKPIVCNYNSPFEYEFNYENTDAYGYDFYPINLRRLGKSDDYYKNKDFNFTINGYCNLLFENMVRFNKEFSYHWIQSFDYGMSDSLIKYNLDGSIDTNQYGWPNKYVRNMVSIPTIEYLRYALFASTVKSINGQFNFTHNEMFLNDTLFQKAYHCYGEYNFYLDWFKTNSLKSKVSTNSDILSYSNRYGSGTKMPYNDFNLYKKDDVYILVSINGYNSVKYRAIDYSVDIDISENPKVYLLSPDYFNNGVYKEIKSVSYTDLLNFKDTVEQRQVHIYAIGGLPAWNKPDEWIEDAEFGNSNQRQFVAFPKIEDTADPNLISSYKTEEEVYYHTVYQRLENGRYNIYYRRSKPVIKGEDTEESPEGKLLSSGIIQWEPEICVSNNIILKNTVIGPMYDPNSGDCESCSLPTYLLDSRNPSIIVDKRNTNEVAKVRIYFNAKPDYLNPTYIRLNDPCQYYYDYTNIHTNVIASVEFPAFYNVNFPPNIQPKMIASYNGNLTDHGNPVANSSYEGNFIAWSDNLYGIVFGFLESSSDCFLDNNINSISYNINCDARHPSINPYSKKSEKHRDIGLVWQEKQTEQPESSFEIYYTRVGFMDGNKTTLQHFITDPSSTYYPHNHGFIIHPTKKILELSTGYETNTHTKPIIVRNVEIVTRPGDTWVNRHHKFDRVYWESVNFSTNKKFISFASMDYYDEWNYQTEYMYEDRYFYAGPDRIGGVDVNLKSPNNTNGIMSYDKPTNSHSDISDSIQVLNFIQEGSGNNNTIWHLNTGYWDLHNHWSILGSNNFYNYDDDDDPIGSSNRDSYIQKVMGTGDMPQIPVSPHTIGRLNWYFTKRLFEFDRNGTKEIVPSIEHFLKPTFGSISEYPIILNGFTDDEEYSDMYSSLEVKTKSGNVIEIPLITQDSLIRSKKNQDVMYTPYFYLDSLNEIDFYQSGHILENKTNVYLERKEDNKKVKLNLNRFNNMKLEKNNYLVRGNKRDVYRLVIENKNKSNSRNVQELLISGIPDPNSIDSKRFYKSNFQEKGFELVDFKDENFTTKLNLNLYPNPSSNKFNILTDIPKNISDFKLKYTLFDLNGLIIDEFSSSQLNIEYNLENINLKYFYIKVEMIDCNDCSIKSDMKLMIKK